MFSFLYPLKTPENFSFLVFSGGIKRKHWPRFYFNLTVNFEDFTNMKMNLKSITSGVH